MTGEHSTTAFVDAHCHVDLFPHPARIVEQAEAQRIYTIAVTNAPSVFEHTARLADGSKYIRPALGLHPELVHSHKHELDQFHRYLPQTRYIGEVGLDYTTPDQDIRSQQRQVLATIAGWVDESEDKVLTLHSRRAVSDTLDVLKGIKARMILHWFSGSNKELDRAIAEGYFFSVNGAMMQSAKGRALVVHMPKDRVVTETDGPFVKNGNSPAAPAEVKVTVTHLGDLWGLPHADAQAKVLENFRTVLVGPLPQ
jgi:TatD DNase family protein